MMMLCLEVDYLLAAYMYTRSATHVTVTHARAPGAIGVGWTNSCLVRENSKPEALNATSFRVAHCSRYLRMHWKT